MSEDNKDKYPWIPKFMFLTCMAVAGAFFVTGWILN
jgi:hypothetical protein